MRLTRIYLPEQLQSDAIMFLDERSSHHVLRVLRLQVKDPIIIFDGRGHEFHAEIVIIQKQSVQVLLQQAIAAIPESPLDIHLGQAISRGEKMDYTVQKAVELGVKTITPLFTEYGGVKLSAERLDNKMAHWRKIVISACEQSGRSYLPSIAPPQYLPDWLKQRRESCKLLLHPGHARSLKAVLPPSGQVCLLTGPEGGFTSHEVMLSQQFNFEIISLGPRILRTETAAPAAIAAMQCLWGDMG